MARLDLSITAATPTAILKSGNCLRRFGEPLFSWTRCYCILTGRDVKGEWRVAIVASQDIAAGEELSYDYNFQVACGMEWGRAVSFAWQCGWPDSGNIVSPGHCVCVIVVLTRSPLATLVHACAVPLPAVGS